MSRDNHSQLRFGWARQIKQLAAAGDLTALGELVDFAEGHLEQIGVFDRQWIGILNGATQRGLAVEISKEYALRLLQAQEFRCAITGLPIGFRDEVAPRPGRKLKGTASLDRIDSALAYVPGNVWWVHRDINRMKWNLPLSRFVELCQLVARNADALLSARPPQPPMSDATTLGPSQSRIVGNRAAVQIFLDRATASDPAGEESAERLWRSFRGWCAQVGAPEASQTLLGRGLAMRGYQRITSRTVRWFGVRLTPEGLDSLDQGLTLADPIEAWWVDRLRRGGFGDPPEWPSLIGCEVILRDCLSHLRRDEPSGRSQACSFGNQMRKLVPRIMRVRAVPPGTSARVWCYRLPPLVDCRERFDLRPPPDTSSEGCEGCEGGGTAPKTIASGL